MPNPFLTNVTMPLLEMDELENLLQYLKQILQIDLTLYKRSSLLRRTLVRMQQVEAEHYHDYFTRLQQQPDEALHLLNIILINFTGFFRDRSVWDYLENQVIPQILANKAPDEPIRIWSAGCASGEETYSLAMLLIEALGLEQFQQRVWLYGTDIDADAIFQARKGYYPDYKIEAIPAALREQYFERRDNGYCWRQNLYGSLNFHVHNLIQPSLLPQIDLLVCRNLLMYLTEETQLQTLASLYSSLKDNGFLLLGKAETLVTHPQRSLFTPLYRQGRVFKKVPNVIKVAPSSHYLPSMSDFMQMKNSSRFGARVDG